MRTSKKSKAQGMCEGIEKAIDASEDKVTVTTDGEEYITAREAKNRLSELMRPFRTKWLGVWKNDNSEYACSCVMSKDIINLFTDGFKVVIKRNNKHREGENTPCYTFAFCGIGKENRSNQMTSKDIMYYEDSDTSNEDILDELDDNTTYITVDKAIRYARSGADSISSGYDPYDVYCSCDLQGQTLRELVEEYL